MRAGPASKLRRDRPRVPDRIFNARFAETFQPQLTRIAFAAGAAVGKGIVTTVGERKIDIQFYRFPDDVRFGHFDQRRVNLNSCTFDPGFGADIGDCLKQCNELRTTIGVTAVIDRVRANKNVAGRNGFGPGKCVREKNRVSRGNVSDRNPGADFFFRARLRNIEIVGER